MSTTVNDPLVRQALIDNYNSYAEGLDSKNWPLDYGAISAPTGAPEVPRRADDWMKNLQGVINGFDITRHTITNHRFFIAEGEISCRAYLRADHVIFANPEMPVIGPEEVVVVVGEYTNRYREIDGCWKICKSELEVNWSEGNFSLLATATERAMALQSS